jgi:diguanylate cyclase (GGDEF)-like protein
MEMQLSLMVLGMLSLPLSLFSHAPDVSQQAQSMFFWITVAAILLLAVGYGLSRMAKNYLSGLLAVFTVLSVTFVAVIVNPHDLTTTSYLILGGLVCSLFLPARSTAHVFLLTSIGLLLLPRFLAGFSMQSALNALYFIVTIGAFIIMETMVRQRYLQRIDRQSRQLMESEARLRELSIRDPLTGLFNRRYLEEVFTLEINRATRKHFPIGVIMADIDHFKRLNDTYGHAAGDAVLSEVGQCLQSHVRASDVACRYGGEEFLILLPEASLATAKMRAEQMREAIRRAQVHYAGTPLESVTASLGVAIFPDHGSTIDEIVHAADAAMYSAKRQGRDRVAVAPGT